MAIADVERQPSVSEAFLSSLLEAPDGKQIRFCIQCGICSGVCPYGAWMSYPPRRIIAALHSEGFEEVIDNDTIWMCVSCYACTNVCPADISLTEELMARTKEELLLAGNIPDELQSALKNTGRYGNPLGVSPRKRAAWTKGLPFPVPVMREARRPVDLLWFVGDYASYHPRAQQAARALAKILHALNGGYLRCWPLKTGGRSVSINLMKSSPEIRMRITPSKTNIQNWGSPSRCGITRNTCWSVWTT